jgi:hypothetical protein
MTADPEKRLGVVLFANKHNPLEGAFGVLVDPLIDLGDLAVELLDRLEPAPAKAQR